MKRREPSRGRQRLAPMPLAQTGALLRQERERRGLSAADVARAIRFSERHVVALEEGRADDLPPRPYARGILVAYAGLLGFDAAGPGEARRPPAPPSQHRAGGRRRWRSRNPREFNWRDWTVPLACAGAVAASIVLRLALAPPTSYFSTPPPPPPAPPAAVQPAAEAEQPIPAAEPASEPPPEKALPATPVSAAPGVRVLLRSEGTTWVEYASDSGERRRLDLLPGRSLEITGQERVALSLGDAGVVRVRVNERELGFIGHKGETKTGLSFTPPPPAPAGAAAAAD